MIKQFIEDKRFYGCGGLTITDEVRVTIAAEACLLLVNKGGPVYPELASVLVYPTAETIPTYPIPNILIFMKV